MTAGQQMAEGEKDGGNGAQSMADLIGTQWSCRFCHHVWRGRVPHPPVRCPSCKRPKWAATAPAAKGED